MNVCPPVCWSVVPSWLILEPEVDLCTLNNNKRNKSGDIVKEVKTCLQKEWRSYLQIYADGSKDRESRKVASGETIPELRIHRRQNSDQMSVFTKMMAVLWALWCLENNKPDNSVICSDSAAALTTIREIESMSRPDTLTEVYQTLYRIYKAGCEVAFIWVPARMSVDANEEADYLAKNAAHEERIGNVETES